MSTLLSRENLPPAGDLNVKGFINSGTLDVGPGSNNLRFGTRHSLGSFENFIPLIDLYCEIDTLSAYLPAKLGGE